jgi:hypothetical protein
MRSKRHIPPRPDRRVSGPALRRHGNTGVYATDCEQVAHAVREWAIEQGRNPLMRICLAGYAGEHEMPSDWRVEEWEATGGYGLISDDDESTGRANKGRERLWFSPACLRPERAIQRSLLGDSA